MKRRHYTSEFKRSAVALVIEEGRDEQWTNRVRSIH